MRTVPPCWGLYDTYSARAGSTWRRLVVLPPGSTPAEARAFHWAAESSWAGVAAAQLAFALLAPAFGAVTALLIATCGCAAGLAVLRHRSSRARAGARRLSSGPDPEAEVAHRVVALAQRLQAADDALQAGRIDAVGHERVWSSVWEQLAAAPAAHRAYGTRKDR